MKNNGKLYACYKWYLVLYETLENAKMVYEVAKDSVCTEDFDKVKLFAEVNAGYRPHIMACEEDWLINCKNYWENRHWEK